MKKIHAFSLVEIIIVVMIIATVAVGLSLSFSQSKKSATFKDYETQILSILQKARSLSFSDLNVESIEVDHYTVTVDSNYVSLQASDGSTSTELERVDFASGYSIDSTFSVTYTPPNGDVTFSDGSNSKTFVFSATGTTYSSTFFISSFGSAYPEIEN